MIISTAEELRAFLPNHVMDDLESMMGFLDNSEHDFLAERIGAPLLDAVNEHYLSMNEDERQLLVPSIDNVNKLTPWQILIVLCQRCVVFDAFARSADIQAISVNNAGLNIAESKNYDSAGDKTIDKYKSQLVKESHAASNRLLIQLEDWQKEMAEKSAIPKPIDEDPDNDSHSDGPEVFTDETEDDGNDSSAKNEEDYNAEITCIVNLWKKSKYYYYADGLLFNTATDFNLYVDIYNSREKFIQLLPDIRFCQEVQIESEIGTELLSVLIEKFKSGAQSVVEQKAYNMLRRSMALMVEARSSLFKRVEAKDEASGMIKLTLDYMRKHQRSFDKDAVKKSPIYDPKMWCEEVRPHHHNHADDCMHPHEHKHIQRCHYDDGPGMLITSII